MGTDSSLEYVILQNQYMLYLFIYVCVYIRMIAPLVEHSVD